MPNVLDLKRFGNPVLRQTARTLSIDEICSVATQKLIADIRHTNEQKQYGVGLAAPQIGVSVALSVIGIKPTPTRPNVQPFERVIINPRYTGVGRRVPLWEGCQSCGTGNDTLYAQVPRYRKIEASWYDEKGGLNREILEDFVAHVFQHETDHLNGILFVDKVRDTKSYMLVSEYRERILKA